MALHSQITMYFDRAEARAARTDISLQNYNFSSIAEVGTLQLEFKYLAHLTGQRKYWDKVDKVMEVIEAMNKQDGLVSIYVKCDDF